MPTIHRCTPLPAAFVAAALLSAPLLAVSQADPTTPNPSAGPVPASAASAPAASKPEALGDSLMGRRRYQAAIDAYKLAPEPSATLWNKMGIAYQMMFNFDDATRCYEKSLKLDPKNVNVLNNLGTVYDSLKEYKLAVKMYHRALKIQPQSALVLKNLGTDLLAQHQYKKGWAAYQSALAVDPQIFDQAIGPRAENPATAQERGAMNYYMAKGCVRAGNPDRAIEYLRLALNEGFTSPKKIAADQEFAGLHGTPAFEQLLAEQKTQ